MFSLVQRIPQKYRIPLVAAVIPSLVIMLLTYSQCAALHKQAVEACISQAKSVCRSAESVRTHAELQWERNVFQQEEIKEWAKNGETEQLMSTVPIISSIASIRDSAKDSGFVFRVPTLNPRNPENAADEFEKAALAKLDATGAAEVIEINPVTNTLHYFRPVRMSESCLKCHGSPATSVALWDNDKGIDGTGFLMENAKTGDLKGAFEIVSSLEKADADARAAFVSASGFALGSLVLCGLLSLVILKSVQMDVRNNANAIGTEVAQEVSDGTAGIASAIEQLSANIRDIADGAASASGFAREVVIRVENTNAKGTMLNKCSSEIGNIVQLIEAIAEQTNLLALNATIEAARAGDTGKGFAVVAGEVKELARETSKATSAITQKITAIQTASGELLLDLGAVRDVIRRIDSSQTAISGAVHEQKAATDEIGRAVHGVLESSRKLTSRLTSSKI